jgi:hypothetical protein
MKSIFIAVLLTACIVACNINVTQPKENLALPSSTEQFDLNATPFIYDETIAHHLGMRELMPEFLKVGEYVKMKLSEEEIFEIVLGDELTEDWYCYTKQLDDKSLLLPDKSAAYIVSQIEKRADPLALLEYLDTNDCRTLYNEFLLSSYVVFFEEFPQAICENDSAFFRIDWAGVVCIDAGAGVAASGIFPPASPAAGLGASAGAVLGSVIRQLIF